MWIRHTSINLLNTLLSENITDLLGELLSHVLSAAVDRDTVHGGIRTSNVDEFEAIRGVRLVVDNLAELGRAALLQEAGLARKNIHNVIETELLQNDGLGCEHVVLGAGESVGGSRTNDKRTNTVGVTIKN